MSGSEASPRDRQATLPPERSGKSTRWLIVGLLVLLAAIVGRIAWFWYLSDPTRQIRISRETTYLEGPLTQDGYVDYLAAVNALQSEGVTPDNNAVIPLVQAIGPGRIEDDVEPRFFELLGAPVPPKERRYLLDEADFVRQYVPGGRRDENFETMLQEQVDSAMSHPWKRADYPAVAALLEQNADALALVIESSRRERYYAPFVSTGRLPEVMSAQLPIEQQLRSAVRQLVARAMLKLGEGDIAAAWQDLLACHRHARLTGESPSLLGLLVSVALEDTAFTGDQALIASPQLTAEQAQTCLSDLQALKPRLPTADRIDTFVRLMTLDTVVAAARSPLKHGSGGLLAVPPLLNGAIDWNVPLQQVNEEFDALVAVLRESNEAAQREFFNEQFARYEKVQPNMWGLALLSFVGGRKTASRQMGDVLLRQFQPATLAARNTEWRGLAQERLLRVGFALVAHQRTQGSYPERLNELVPDRLPEVPRDPWTNKELKYRRMEDGFLVYSLDLDRQDDGGVAPDPDAGRRYGDIVIRVGSDE